MIVEIVLGLLVLAEGYVIWNLTRKTEMLETWVEGFSNSVTNVSEELKEIDATGHFEADDAFCWKKIEVTLITENRYKNFCG